MCVEEEGCDKLTADTGSEREKREIEEEGYRCEKKIDAFCTYDKRSGLSRTRQAAITTPSNRNYSQRERVVVHKLHATSGTIITTPMHINLSS